VPSKLTRLFFMLMIAAAAVYAAQGPSAPAPPAASQTAPQSSTTAPQQTAPPPSPAPAPAQPSLEPTAPPQKTLGVVIVDPAHGGADPGARGSSGIAESEVVLGYARLLRISLEAQGMRVLLTRQANDDPSFDDRSRLANSYRNGVFISLHVSSTGQPGTVRVYSMARMATAQNSASAPRGGLLPWDRAQNNFIDQSRRLAELIQIQMAQRFHGSSETPFEAPVRQLRTVGAPAVAIEVSSVSVPERGPLDQMGSGIADGVARAVAAFRTIYESGGR
jgi:N-acetylmuramoyl-L-alanine amidase